MKINKTTKIVMILLFIIMFSQIVLAESYHDFIAVADTYGYENFPNDNNGQMQGLYVGREVTGKEYKAWMVLFYDSAYIPSNSVVYGKEFRMYIQDIRGSPNIDWHIATSGNACDMETYEGALNYGNWNTYLGDTYLYSTGSGGTTGWYVHGLDTFWDGYRTYCGNNNKLTFIFRPKLSTADRWYKITSSEGSSQYKPRMRWYYDIKPTISAISNLHINEDDPGSNVNIDLWDYIEDLDDPNNELNTNIYQESNANLINCYISANRYLTCNNPQPNQFGQNVVTIRTQDGHTYSNVEDITIYVDEVPDPPVLSGCPDDAIDEDGLGSGISVDLFACHNDVENGDNVDFTIDSESNSGLIDCRIDNNRYLKCNDPIPNGNGYSNVVVRSTDSTSLFDTDTIKVIVNSINDPVSFVNAPDTMIDEDDLGSNVMVDLFPYASDPDHTDTELTFSVESQTNSALINCNILNDRYLTCSNPVSNQYGTNGITLKVTDGEYSATDIVQVIINSVPDAPTLANCPDDNINEDTLGSGINVDLYDCNTDPEDGDSVTFSVQSQSNTNLINCYISANRYLTCDDPTLDGEGNSDVVVKSTDPGGLNDIDTIKVIVNPVNDPPDLVGCPDSTISEDDISTQIASFQSCNYDVDITDTWTYSIVSQSNSDLVSVYFFEDKLINDPPATNQNGFSDVVVRVTDSGGLTDDFEVRINVLPVNDPPRFENCLDQSLNEDTSGALINYDLQTCSVDVDNDVTDLTYTLSYQSNPELIDCYLIDNFLTCHNPTLNENGFSEVKIEASDGEFVTDTDAEIFVNVLPVNDPPELINCPDGMIEANGLGSDINIDLWNCFSDVDNLADDGLYSITTQTNEPLMICSLTDNRYVSCSDPPIDMLGSSQVNIEVTDGEFVNKSNLMVSVVNVVTDLSLDVTNNSIIDWSSPGVFWGEQMVALDQDLITNFLETCEPDEEGNCILPLRFESKTIGKVNVTLPNFYYALACVEQWNCTEWSGCDGSTQTRTCTDDNSCGTIETKPAESQSCGSPAPSGGGGSGGGGRKLSEQTTTQETQQETQATTKLDSDGDLIPDDVDTYPFDYDNDGLPDEWETQHFNCLSCAYAEEDSDNDGLTNLQEYEQSLDPFNIDTDGDGISDSGVSLKPKSRLLDKKLLYLLGGLVALGLIVALIILFKPKIKKQFEYLTKVKTKRIAIQGTKKEKSLSQVLKKYKRYPKSASAKKEIERAVAFDIFKKKKRFSIVEVMKKIEKNYKLKIEERNEMYGRILEWIRDDKLCVEDKFANDTQYYEFIT